VSTGMSGVISIPKGSPRAIPIRTASSCGRGIRLPRDQHRQLLTVEVAEDEAFRRVIAHAQAPVSSAADWTARVLIGGLKPARTYWYRFTDADGNGSRSLTQAPWPILG
jgi:phosphodiesterase/alkaline phosphatase D-like protein